LQSNTHFQGLTVGVKSICPDFVEANQVKKPKQR
jgi:hypothetical protein